MNLDLATRTLQIVITAAKTTADMPVIVHYEDQTTPQLTNHTQTSKTNGTSPVTILSAPNALFQRKVKDLSVCNQDTAEKTVQIGLMDNATLYPIISATLQIGDTLGFTDTDGWYTIDASGNRKLSLNPFTGGATFTGPVDTTATTLTVAAATAAGHAIQAGQTIGRNKIINGDFKVNQKAFTSPQTLVTGVPSTGAGYGHDMWRGGSSGCTYSFTNANLGLSSVATITAGSLITAVESVNIDATTYVLSWTSTAVARIGVNGASPSGNFAASPIYITTAVIGAQVSVEFAMSGSLGGSTIVNTGTGTLSLVQMEEGVYKTTFERKLYSQVLAECQRYLPLWSGNYIGTGQAATSSACYIILQNPVPVRTPVTSFTQSGGTGVTVTTPAMSSVLIGGLAFSSSAVTSAMFYITAVAGSPFTAGQATTIQMNGGILYGTGAQI